MQNFAEQCLDMARAILSHNLDAINDDGSIAPVEGEQFRQDEPGHVALALGEFYRLTGETQIDGNDIVDLCARCITAQTFMPEEAENGLAYAALGLLAFSPAKDRNQIWERLQEITREELDKRLLARTDYVNHQQAFNVAKAVARFSMGLSKKDETGKLVDKFVDRIKENSSNGFFDDEPDGFGGAYDIYGVTSLVIMRQALQLHANMHLRDRKLPSLRTVAEKYINLILSIVREDGLGWCFGRGIGAYGQMHCISLLLQAMRDEWIQQKDMARALDALRRLFYFFFTTYLDQEQGCLVIRDEERNTVENHTTRMANFDAARYLCQWARIARSLKGASFDTPTPTPRRSGRFVVFDKSHRKEQGLFIYRDPESKLHLELPLLASCNTDTSDILAFPHCPGVFDWPATKYLPVMLPELTFGEDRVIPAFYGKNCTTGLGLRNSFYFRYEQPSLITVEKKNLNFGNCKVNWTFDGNKISSEFLFTVNKQVTMDSMRYVVPIGAPHSKYRFPRTLQLGSEGQRPVVEHDDFVSKWAQPEQVSNDPEYRTCFGNIHYLQVLHREHALIMRPNNQYRLTISYEPQVIHADGA